ncbi:MAG: benzoate degradation ring-cleavage hydrolase [Labilithrix sp.]|jgi:pimeloyl-ACP methyl ester carboxylesterase|nr:benzoate degradation ring-cleavage hydrolase [Labilithrix sp.]
MALEVVRFTDFADGPTLVFLHEGLGSAKQWRDFPKRVGEATKLSAIAYSRIGYGASDPVTLPRPLTYMQDEAKYALPALLDELDIASAILVGHSDGGSIAIVHAAVDAGARIRGIVLEAPHVFVEDVSIASIANARKAYEMGDLREKLAKHHGDNVDGAFRGWNDAWLDPAFRAWNIEEYLPRIEVPVLVIQGEDDPYGTRAQVDAISRQVKGRVETLMLPQCGHAPHRDQPETTLDAIARFVAGIREV